VTFGVFRHTCCRGFASGPTRRLSSPRPIDCPKSTSWFWLWAWLASVYKRWAMPDVSYPSLFVTLRFGTWLKIVSSWPTSAADHCDRLMSWRVPQKEHERVSETGVLDRVSGTLCLSHYVDFWRQFGLCTAAAHSDCCVFAPCTNILTYLLTCHLAFLKVVMVRLGTSG